MSWSTSCGEAGAGGMCEDGWDAMGGMAEGWLGGLVGGDADLGGGLADDGCEGEELGGLCGNGG